MKRIASLVLMSLIWGCNKDKSGDDAAAPSSGDIAISLDAYPFVEPDEHAQGWLTNTTSAPVETTSTPFAVRRGETIVLATFNKPYDVTIGPGQQRKWAWDLKDSSKQVISPGLYVIVFRGQGSSGQWERSVQIEVVPKAFGPVTLNTTKGKFAAKTEPVRYFAINRSYAVATLTSRGASRVSGWWFWKSEKEILSTVTSEQLWPKGGRVMWSWDQHDGKSAQVEPGTYSVWVKVGKDKSRKLSREFKIVKP